MALQPRIIFRFGVITLDSEPLSESISKTSSEKVPDDCRVWIVEDHISINQMLEALLETLPGFKLVGACSDGKRALLAAERGEVDLVILDLMIPGEGGMNTLMKLNKLPEPPKVLIYSATATVHSLRLAIALGAYGYVEKSDRIEELRSGLKQVRIGAVHFSQGPSRLLTALIRTDRKVSGDTSELELDLLGLLARGLTLKEAAFEMKISQQKAYRIRQRLVDSAKARNSQDLTRYAIEIGLAGSAARGAD